MVTLNKNSILGADDSGITSVAVPEWDGNVHLRIISGKARGEWETLINARSQDGALKSFEGVRGWLLVRAMCDESGALLFEEADAEELESKSSVVIDRLFDEAVALSKLMGGDDDSPFGNDQSADSGTD